MPKPNFQLYYWPIPFRGCFISYLFAYRGVPLLIETSLPGKENNEDLQSREQYIPYMGPPVLQELETNRTLSQMPAIVLYVSRELKLTPDDPFDVATCTKVLMDCNDLLMEICRFNGSIMWERNEWQNFRALRFVQWMEIFEESLRREFIGRKLVSFADIGVFALFGNMTRCLPELKADLRNHAPGIYDLCQKIGSEPSLASFVADEELKYGKTYCGGQIEQSIRKMLEMDAIDAG